MFYSYIWQLYQDSCRPSNKNGWNRDPALLRLKRLWLPTFKVRQLAGIKRDLIMSRRVLNTLERVSGKGIFNFQI